MILLLEVIKSSEGRVNDNLTNIPHWTLITFEIWDVYIYNSQIVHSDLWTIPSVNNIHAKLAAVHLGGANETVLNE